MPRTILSFFALPLLVFGLALAVLFPPVESHGGQERGRLALVIGNGNYDNGQLGNPTNDAQDMAKALSDLGFIVIYLQDADLRSMEDAVRDFGDRLEQGGVGLFYFAGHGIQMEGRNFLVPISAHIEKESDVKYEAMDVGRVLDAMDHAGNGLNIVLLDACRNNPFARSFRSPSQGLANMDAPTGTIIAYATAPGSVASDGDGRNGVYTGALLKHLNEPGLTIEQLLKKVRVDVIRETASSQVPWESSSLTGDFAFSDGTVAATTPPTPQPTPKPLMTERDDQRDLILETDQDTRVRGFIEEYHRVQNMPDLPELRSLISLYADRVDYYGVGVVTRDFILKDKKDYYARWPMVHFDLAGAPSIRQLPDGQTVEVRFEVVFMVRNSQKWISGNAINTLRLRPLGQSFVIVDEKQTVLSRNKGSL